MSTKSSSHKSYVGPRALFDPFYIPSELIGLKKEQNSLQSILKDAIQDNFPLMLSLYGLRGIGKTTLTRKTIANLGKPKNEILTRIDLHYVNCEEKNTNQIIFALINNLSQSLKCEIDPRIILNANPTNLVNFLSLLISKSVNMDKTLIFFLNSNEFVQPQLINKLMDICTTRGCYLITSYNLLKSSPYLLEFKKPDIQIQLNAYSPENLEKICRNRCKLAFKTPVDSKIIRYLTDLVHEFDYCVPESCLRILRDLYPIIERSPRINPSEIQDACRYQFKRYSIDEIGIAEFITETDLVDRVALDEISSFFQSQTRYYISYGELKTMYQIACESLEFEFSHRDFILFLKNLENIALLQPSNFKFPCIHPNKQQRMPYYFLTISPQILNEILNVAFGLVSFE